ncbi:MAG: hypothetical protein GX458_13645 [Phyllobacteriaceae bacterium]|nr:hypothetical protein [Phyllobacteriaceae bacterium]
MATAPTGSKSETTDGARRTAVRLTMLVVLTLFLVSAAMLTRFGIPYASSSGPMPTKIHPATYLALFAVLAWARAEGGIGRLGGRVVFDHPGVVVFGLGTLLLLFQTIVVVKLPIAPIVDTFILPILLFVALTGLNETERDRTATILHVMMVANAAIGIVEFASGRHLTPMYEADGTLITYEWRATALLGHPLVNAATTGAYVVALAFGATPRMPPLVRLGVIGLCSLAMLGFGGRVALVTMGAMVAVAAALGGLHVLAGRRFRLGHAVLGVLMVTLTLVFFSLFIDLGGADKFLSRFDQDYGSAQTRMSMLKIFGDLTNEQFLLWPDAELIWQAQREHAIRIGVESSEVGFVANYGLLVTIAFFLALGAFLRELVVATSARTWWTILYFAVVMSSSLGIAAKSTVLALFVVLTVVVMPRTKPATGAAIAPPPS